MVSKSCAKITCAFLVAFLGNFLFCGCTGFTTDWSFSMGFLSDNSDPSKTENEIDDNLVPCESGRLKVKETSEDGLSGKISLIFEDADDSLYYNYEFRNDTLAFMNEGEDVYVFTDGRKGLLYGWWTLNQPSGTTYWLMTSNRFSIYVKYDEECPDL